MSALAFDTHLFVKELTAVGFTEAQAKAVTSVVKRTRSAELDEIATRTDLIDLKSDLEKKLAEIESSPLRWVLGAIGFQAVLILGGVLAIAKLHV